MGVERSDGSGSSASTCCRRASRRRRHVGRLTGTTTANVEPRDGRLSTSISPWTSRHRCLTSDRPSPEPPWRRVLEPSTWRNSSKMWGSASGGMPMPVSATAIATSGHASPSRSSAETRIEPRWVNFAALVRKCIRICRSRPRSLSSGARPSGSSTASSTGLSPSAGRTSRTHSSTSLARWNVEMSGCPWRVLSCAKSRMSLIAAWRVRALATMRSAKWRPLSLSGPPEPRSNSDANPMTDVSGVLSSCETLARNSLFRRFISRSRWFARTSWLARRGS